MEIGDMLQIRPTLDPSAGLGTTGPLPCTVVYIHPQRRFYVVEFSSPVTGERWRETEYFPASKNSDDFLRLPIIGGRKG